jgi:hypothetical protein
MGMQARAGGVTKVGKVSGKQWVFHSTEKSIKFFLSNGLSYKLEFCVIISRKS